MPDPVTPQVNEPNVVPPVEPVVPVVVPVVDPVVKPVEPVVPPVVEPVVPPVVEPGVQLPEPAKVEFEPTGNEYIDDTMQFLSENDVDVEKAFSKVFESGDPADIDMAYLEEKVGKVAARGLVAGLVAENTKLEASAKEGAAKIYASVDGVENWQSIMDWVGAGESGLSTEGQAAYNTMLAAGGVQAELAAKELYTMFKASPGFIVPAVVVGGDATAQPGQLEPISRIAYVQEMDKVIAAEGANSPKLALLDKRREFSMSKGM